MEKILIIEDSDLTIGIIKKSLEGLFKLYFTSNAEDGLIFAREKRPDLIILDILLPDTSGFEVLSEIKTSKITKHIPVVLMSAKTGTVSRTTGYNLGAINYIEKPFSVSELLSIVKTTLRQTNTEHEFLEIENLKINQKKHLVYINGQKIKLTNSQYKLLFFLVKNLYVVFSRERLIEVVYAESDASSLRSIDNLISVIRKILDGSELKITTVYGKGYKLGLK
ncbi:MAG: response regulator transcription factor [Halobacteriovoraceae bacterium]|nr:response regulator transcription factor [Halobacteriovoraceae bacterium]